MDYTELGFDPDKLRTPYYITDERLLIKNLEILKYVSEESGCKILLAQKAFSMYAEYPLIAQYLDGTAASGLFEARLGYEEMKNREVHVFSAAYREDEIDEILEICSHIVFNSFSEWERYSQKATLSGKKCGIRINPEHSTQKKAIYDPCAPNSRLGVTRGNFPAALPAGITGFHFHTLCEQDSGALIETLDAVEKKFGGYFGALEWINFGGGHHITRKDYDTDALIACITDFKRRRKLDVYLEPGEAIALNAGFLAASVLDIVNNGKNTAILDASAACHMPDVLEMPYRPAVAGAGMPGEKPYNYLLAGATCLAGDLIGEYSFDLPLKRGDKIIFRDMSIYSMVKNNTFNGMPLPSIAAADTNGTVRLVKKFDYRDFKRRL